MKRRAIGDYARSAQPRSTLDMRHWWVQVGEESPKHARSATGDLRLRDQASHGCRVRLWNLTTRNPPSNPRAPPVWDRKCPVPVREPGAHACRRPDRTDGTGAPMPEAEPVSYCRVVNTVRRAVTRTCRVQVAAHLAVACPGGAPHSGDAEGVAARDRRIRCKGLTVSPAGRFVCYAFRQRAVGRSRCRARDRPMGSRAAVPAGLGGAVVVRRGGWGPEQRTDSREGIGVPLRSSCAL